MKVILAKKIGFCPGVKRALFIAEKSIKKDPKPVQFLGELVHNEKVIERLGKQKTIFLKKVGEIKPGTVVIQAHGFPPLPKRTAERLIIRDATCPLVKKIQLIAKSFHEKEYKIIIIGDKKHPETKGIKGWCGNKALVVENKDKAEKLGKFDKVLAVAQSTQETKKVKNIVAILRRKAKTFKFINTLCPEVQKRQDEVERLSEIVDAFLVIGGKQSSNTKKLFQVCKTSKKKVWWINSPEETKKEYIQVSRLGIVSGTSSPDWLIKKIIKQIKCLKRKQK